jgi:hypothetical protein
VRGICRKRFASVADRIREGQGHPERGLGSGSGSAATAAGFTIAIATPR